MKTKFLFILLAIVSLTLNSCSENEKTTAKYILDTSYRYSPATEEGKDLAKAITTYQFDHGYFKRVYTVELTGKPTLDELDKKAEEVIAKDLGNTDYIEAVRKAGLEMTTSVTIEYLIKYEFDKDNANGRTHSIIIEYVKP